MKLQVIGDPVLHSKSPIIQGAMLAALGLDDITYTAHVVRRGELPDYLRWARDHGVAGFNATMPHKEDLIPLLDETDPAARAAGAVNTVVLRDGRAIGHSTDGPGFAAALEHELRVKPQGLTVTLLGAGGEYRDQSKEWRAGFTLSPKQLNKGRKLLKAAALLLFCFPGSPTVYYGDEVGMQGFEDPFNRQTYPWGREDRELLEWYRALGRLRSRHPALRRGSIRYLLGKGPLLVFLRETGDEQLLCAFNAGGEEHAFSFDEGKIFPLIGRPQFSQMDGLYTIALPPRSGAVFSIK